MKSHPQKRYADFHGVNLSYQADRIDDRLLAALYNAWCDPTGQIQKAFGYYPVTLADAFGLTTASARTKVWTMAKMRGKDSNARALAVAGAGLFMCIPNNLYDAWAQIAYTAFEADPELDQPCAIVFRNRFGYVQNLDDMPFRVRMENDDGSDPSWEAEPLGLRPPLVAMKFTSGSATDASGGGAGRFPPSSKTMYAVTFVYGDNGDRGESAPSVVQYLWLTSAENYATVTFTDIPLGPTGCTARRIYRSEIGRGYTVLSGEGGRLQSYFPRGTAEMFFLTEIPDNTTQTLTDLRDNSGLDYTRRMPPARPFPPRSKYQVLHLDRLFWAHLREHPWVMAVHSDEGATSVSATVTISNTGNGTITIAGTGLVGATVSDYKTKSLRTIFSEIAVGFDVSISIGAWTTSEVVARIAPGVDWERTYVFREVTSQNIFGSANVFWFEAIDGGDGCQYYRNRVMFSDLAFPEEVNPFNQFEIAKDDAYPITNLQRDDFTLCVATQDKWWLATGDFVPNELFVPNFAVSASRAEHGSLCTRPDAAVSTPYGIFFISLAGLRILRGGSDAPAGMEIDKLLMERLLVEPRTRDNPCLEFWQDTLYIAFPANVTV